MFARLTLYTGHAVKRMQQRGKSREGAALALRYGRRRGWRGDGVEEFILRGRDVTREVEKRKRWLQRMGGKRQKLRKALHRRMDLLQKMRGCVVLRNRANGQSKVITIYNRARRLSARRR